MSTEVSDASPSTVNAGDDEETKMLKATRQIEFYFADSNLPYDKFMWTLHTANPEHWVPLSTVASFKRMRPFSALGVSWLASALRKCSQELEIDESGENVKRKTEVVEPKGAWERSIYAKGFGKEEPDSQLKLEEFFDKYGRANAVRMRRIDGKKEFKGSVFVEFADYSSVNAFLNADPKPSWNDEELLIMTKEDYCNKKIAEKGLSGKAAELRRASEYSSPAGRGRGFNAFKEGSSGKGKKAEKPKPEVYLQFMGSKLRVHEDEEGLGYVNEEDVVHVKGATLKFKDWEGDVAYKDVKELLRDRFTRVPYIKHEKGSSEGLLGFDKPLSDEDVSFVKETIKGHGGKSVIWSPAEEEEERTFQLERASHAARAVLAGAHNTSRGEKYGRRGGRRPKRGRGSGGDSRGGKRKHEKEPEGEAKHEEDTKRVKTE